jgi:trans-2,3-dihydro-3-hydroxyanthranilate isomerase
MLSIGFFIVDVFAPHRYSGNQLAVFTNAAHLKTDQMQQIAREINFSESSFILTDPEQAKSSHLVRIFTPAAELPFAGHPTLGTAYILQSQILKQPIASVILDLPVGPIDVRIDYEDNQVDRLWMRHNFPTFGPEFSPATIAPMLGLAPGDIDDRFPIQTVSTGLPFIMVPLQNLRALEKIKLDRDRYDVLVADTDAKGIFVFCRETRSPQHQFSARMFAPAWGIPEDPATGSGNGCLAAYLIEHHVIEHPLSIAVEQGYDMGRPSLIYLDAMPSPAGTVIQVGGRVVTIAQGTWQI